MPRQWLERKLVVYVPSTHKNRPISGAQHKQRVNETVGYFTKRYGGTTRIRAVGTWKDNSGVVRERVTKVEVFLDAPVWEKNKREIYGWGKRKQTEWGQTTLAFEKDSRLTFLKGGRAPRARPKRSLAARLLRGY